MSTLFDKYNLHRHIIAEEQDLLEVNMSPGALNDFAKSESAQGMTIGFEMELVMNDLPDEGGYGGSSEAEDDMEMNIPFPEGSRWRQELTDWLTEGDNANGDRDVERAINFLDEEFFEYLDERFVDMVKDDEDIQEEVRKEIHDILALQDKPSDAEAIAAEYDEQTDIYTDAVDRVKDEWHVNNADDIFEDFKMQYRISDMEDFISYINRRHPRVSLSWPYITYSGGDEVSDLGDYLQDVANELEAKLKRVNSAFYVVVSQDYHDESREENKFIIEPDNSISPQGREFISPAMQFADGIAAMQVMFQWAQNQGYKTNQSTGFHMGISLPNHETQNIDHMKFVLMLGDNYVLEKFNRAKAHYAVSTAATMRDTLKRNSQVTKEQVAQYLRQMADGVQDLATAELNKLLVPRGEHRQSVNIKKNYMEIRSAGDNYLPRFDEIRLTLLRYLKTLEISADDQAYRKEYAKKLSKFLTNTNMIRTVDPITGRKSVAAKESLDATVQRAFEEYFSALQRGESGDEAIQKLTEKLNSYKGDKVGQLKQQLRSKRANNDPSATKLKYQGSDRVEFSATGSAYDVLNSFIEQLRDAGMGVQHEKAMYIEAPKGQILYNVEFRYRASTREFSYWCFATDKRGAMEQAKKAWNTGADQPGDSWLAYEQTGDNQSLYYILRHYLDSNKTPPALPVDRTTGSPAQAEQPEARPTTYSLRDHQDRGIMTFTANNDQEAYNRARDIFAHNQNYNLINTTLFRYADDGVSRQPVNLSNNNPEQPTITGRPGEPRPAFTQPQANAEGTPGTFIVTYLSPQGNEQQTAYDVNSATEAATLFRLQHPASYRLHQIERLRESVGESAEISETLKKVHGKWALVSRQNPKKVLQYYHGSGHPSKEWVSKVERRVHSFESTLNEYDVRGYTLKGVFPDGDIQVSGHVLDRADEYHVSKREIDTCLHLAAQKYQRRLFDLENVNFVVRSHGVGISLAVSKVEGINGYYYKVRTLHRQLRTGMGQDVMMVEDSFPAHQNFRVYLDMDGVLADFFGEWSRLSGVNHYKDIADVGAKLQMVREHPTFWTNLPVLPHAKTLVRAVIDMFGEYYICSKPLEGDPRSAPGKRAWIQRNLSEMPPAGIVLTSNKAEFATTETGPAILIDDYGINVNQWQMAGGIGLKYEDTPAGTNLPHVLKVLQKFAKSGSQL
jgi:5'(3')-deoxyribonucleotidase